MEELDLYIKDLESFVENINEIIENIIINKEGLILQKLKLRLFNNGIDGKGNKILPEYSDKTILIKKKNNQKTSHVTLRDTGIFYASFFVDYNRKNSSLFIDSNDSRKSKLMEKYGNDILGLTKQEQDWLIFNIIEPEINKNLKKINNRNINL